MREPIALAAGFPIKSRNPFTEPAPILYLNPLPPCGEGYFKISIYRSPHGAGGGGSQRVVVLFWAAEGARAH